MHIPAMERKQRGVQVYCNQHMPDNGNSDMRHPLWQLMQAGRDAKQGSDAQRAMRRVQLWLGCGVQR